MKALQVSGRVSRHASWLLDSLRKATSLAREQSHPNEAHFRHKLTEGYLGGASDPGYDFTTSTSPKICDNVKRAFRATPRLAECY